MIQIISVKNYVRDPTLSGFPSREILSPSHWVRTGSLAFVLPYWIATQTSAVVLVNTIFVCVAVPADNVSTRIRLFPAALFLSVSRLGGVCGTFQAAELFVVGVKRFDLLHKRSVGDGE